MSFVPSRPRPTAADFDFYFDDLCPSLYDLLYQDNTVIYSAYFRTACLIATEAAWIGHQWNTLDSRWKDNKHPLLTLCQLINPDHYPLPYVEPPPPSYDTDALQHQISNVQGSMVLPCIPAETSIQRTLTPMDHPGSDWIFNHPRACRGHAMSIPHNGKVTRAKYIQYHRFGPYHEIDGIMGKGNMVHWEQLRLP